MSIARILSAFVVSISASLPICSSTLVAQTPCVLAGNAGNVAPVRIGTDSTFAVGFVSAMTGPAYTDRVPLKVAEDGDCRVQLTPTRGATRFRLSLRPTLTVPGGSPTGVISIRIVSLEPAQFAVAMDSVTIGSGATENAIITMQPASGGAGEYALAADIVMGARTYRLPFAVLWTPDPQVSLKTAETECGSDLCLLKGRPQQLELTGPDLGEVDPLGVVNVTVRDAAGAQTLRQPKIQVTSAGAYVIALNPGYDTGNYSVSYELPLRISRLSFDAGGNPTRQQSYTATQTANVAVAPAELVTFHYLDNRPLSELRGASEGTSVRLSAQQTINGISNGGRYQLREVAGGAQAPVVAEFHVERVAGTDAFGILVPAAATRIRSGRNEYSVLRLGEMPYQVHLTVLPPTRVDRVVVLHPSGEQVNGSLHPLETRKVRLEGPAVRALRTASFDEKTVTPEPIGARDSLIVQLDVPRDAAPIELLRLWDVDGAEYIVPIPVLLAQRPNPDLSKYAWLEYGRGPDRDTIDPESAPEVRWLHDVVLRVDPTEVDQDNSLFGVQYLQIETLLFDAAGNGAGGDTICVAIVPPPVGGREYSVSGSCRRVSDELELGRLMEATARATPGSTLLVRIGHEQGQYPKQDIGTHREVSIRRKGWLAYQPRLQLPGAMVAIRNGRTTTALAYTGALLDFQPLFLTRPGGAFSASFQTGLTVGTSPSTATGTDAFKAELSFANGANFRLRNMSGDVTLDFFVGWVNPISGRGIRSGDGYLIFRPGFALSL